MALTENLSIWSGRLRRLGIASLALVLIACVALADYYTEYKTAVSLLYLVAIVLAAWFSWRYVALMITVLGGMSDTIVTCAFTAQCPALNALNSGIQTVFFVVFALVLIALKESQGRLRRLSREDPLTELVNGRHFFEIGNAEIYRALRYKHPLSVVYMDIDNFKIVNDTLGHGAGSTLLREIGKTVKSAVRKTDTMARLGGDEFAILLPETGADAATAAAGRIRKSLLGMNIIKGRPVTLSIGVITNTGRRCAFDELITAADGLMYEAKRGGKNTVRSGTLAGG